MKGIGIQNFRVFKESAYFDFPGITALIGPNSSGKSSLLKLLKLLKENINEGGAPDELNFRGSDHFLGNFRISRNRNSEQKDIVISIPQSLFDDFQECTKNVLVNFHYIEDFRKKELSNGLLIKVSVTHDEEVVFNIDLKVDDKESDIKRGDIHPDINTHWIVSSLHELYDMRLLDMSRTNQYTSIRSGFLPRRIELTQTLKDYTEIIQDKIGFPETVSGDDLKKNKSFRAIKDYFGWADPMGNGMERDRLFCKSKRVLEERLKNFIKYDDLDPNTLNYVKQSVWPPERFSEIGNYSEIDQFTLYPYPLLTVIHENFQEINKIKAKTKKISLVKEKLNDKGYDEEFLVAFIEYYKDELYKIKTFPEIVSHFRKIDFELFEIFTQMISFFHEHFAKDILRLGETMAIYGGSFSEAYDTLQENLIEIKDSKDIEVVKLKNSLTGYLEGIKECITGGILPYDTYYQKEFFDDLKLKNSAHHFIYLQHIFKKNVEGESHKLFRKSFTSRIKSVFDDSLVRILDFTISKKEVDFISLNSIRGSSDRVYSDQDQSTDWRKMVFALANIEPERLDFVNTWIKEFGIGDKLSVVRGLDATSSRVILDHEDFSENLSDLGFGISQMLPIICQIALARQRSNIILEEPEANLHPASQSKLADLFVAAHQKFGHKFLLETHSEYLIRKLQVLVAQGKVDHQKTNVYYFNIEGGSASQKVKQINIQRDGTLSSPFGEGFYDEASNWRYELLKINKEQNN
jgi:predicted ATPase